MKSNCWNLKKPHHNHCMESILIENPDSMQRLVAALENETIIAVDTEFFRETTYYPHLGLIQISSDTITACIDPIAFDAGPGLKKLLLNKDIIKVFHSCSQDLEVLFHHYGFLPQPLHDTQIAESLLSTHEQIGYARLVEAELGISLDKTQTRTNWVKRPLSTAQIQYAGDDVSYLYTLYKKMCERLKQAGRYEWFIQDCERLTQTDGEALTFDVEMTTIWKRIKGSQKLSGMPLALVQNIAVWREQIAMQSDTTRRRVLPDERILQPALSPETISAAGITHKSRFTFSRQQLDELQKIIDETRNIPADQLPHTGFQLPSAEQKAKLKQLQQHLGKQAETLGISSSTLCSRKDLEKLLNGERKLPVLDGWRNRLIGETLLELIQSKTT